MSKYEGKCRQCTYVFAESDTPIVKDMPATCVRCGADMITARKFEENIRDHVFEIVIQGKQNGANTFDSFIMKGEEMMEDDGRKRAIMAKKITEIIAKLITSPNKLNGLLIPQK